ncbi:hypothetical protein AgCh_010008 [Apium graveolens]
MSNNGSGLGFNVDSGSSVAAPIASSNIGFQLLKKHGWKEGTGLGVSEQRITEYQEKLPKGPQLKDDDEDEDEKGEEDEHGDALCGACGENYGQDEFWICCDICEKWFHGKKQNILSHSFILELLNIGLLILEGVDVTECPIFCDSKVQKAVAFARRAHDSQFRKMGDPYLSHCIHTVKILAVLVPSTGKRVISESLSTSCRSAPMSDPLSVDASRGFKPGEVDTDH